MDSWSIYVCTIMPNLPIEGGKEAEFFLKSKSIGLSL